MSENDLISRAAAIEAILGSWNVIKAVENLTAVDAVPVVHGRWVKMTGMMPPEFTGHYECSRCLWHCNYLYERGFNYCPNCGARMDGDGA